MKLTKVIIAFKQHYDIGFTDSAEAVMKRFRTRLMDKTLALIEETDSMPEGERFVWTVPGWPAWDSVGPRQDPDRRERILRAISEKRLALHALPFTLWTGSLELEDLVRGMTFSSRLHRRTGLDELPRDAKMTDILSHSRVLPTLLKHAGVDILHIGCNTAFHPPDVPHMFWWEGPDGSRVLTLYGRAGYGTPLTPPADWPHRAWLALMHTDDNAGPPSLEDVKNILEQARREMPGVSVRIGRMSDFYDALMEENPQIPVVRSDMPDIWIHEIMSMPSESKLARNLRPVMGALETLNTLMKAIPLPVPDIRDIMSEAYEGSILFGEHTWGWASLFFGNRFGDEWVRSYSSGKYKYRKAEATWRDHGDYIRKARSLISPQVEDHMSLLARSIKAAGSRIAVFNPLPWDRGGIVEVDLPHADLPALKDMRSGQIIPVAKEGSRYRWIVNDVPAGGYSTYVPANDRLPENGGAVERGGNYIANSHFRVELAPERCAIGSIIEKRNGRELVDRAAPHPFGYLYERFNQGRIRSYFLDYLTIKPLWARLAAARAVECMPRKEAAYILDFPRNANLEIKLDDISAVAVMKAPSGDIVPHDITIRITLYNDLPFIDLEWEITGKKLDPWPEAGWLSMPFNIPKPIFHLGRLGSVIDPRTDVIRGSNRDVYCLNNGLAVTDGEGPGVGMCALDTPLVSLERPGLYRYSPDFVPSRPHVYVNLFNNCFGTNCQMWTDDSWTSRVRLWTIEKYDNESGLITPSMEARLPLLGAHAGGEAGVLPASMAGVKVSRKGVQVTAFGPNPDGDGILFRLWEQSGVDGPCEIRFPDGLEIKRARPCDLRGRPVGDIITLKDSTLRILLRRYAPASFLLSG